ncbi:calmodulin [Angomonas deanei]|nr:calmodulin [Angomonas deanei]EPY43752.1 calmodulin [Angomonas deanei]|eukprot:EPY39347.1 calmodulin [Angomonas deanei]
MQLPEEELLDLLRVVHQSDRPNQQDDFEFSDFMHLMTHEASDEMISEMKTAFLTYDKSKTGFVTKKQFTEMFISMGEKSNAEELEELLCVAENFVSPDDAEKIDYNKFMTDLVVRLNTM